ncbi:hypothetical protein [Comamonas sp. JC664]|uniref:hypothetical protein n=1 Tax=Comamonas sp. JC664 TaxID=2801917 RepID=UPI00174ECDF2|nr:hypothetical protein [Comamonas sp. JC664]MBL0698310.1 hypothetical protein [Comamonas sp. JC664]GHG89513.1 hypothetical protein GCM10012319_48990 [Comamonas sp. KCTC 72670]
MKTSRLALHLLVPSLLVGCASSSASTRPAEPAPAADATPAAPSGYGYSEEDPIHVGGGVDGELEYLEHLRGPQGQKVRYERRGSCCFFESKESPFGSGMLDVYDVTYDGLGQPVTLYLNMYERKEPRAPEGFTLD